MRRLLCAALLMMLPVCAQALPELGKPAPDFSVQDIMGKQVSTAQYKGKIIVMEWNNPMCPFVKKHYGSGNMQKLQAEMRAKNVVWITVNSGGPGKEGNMNTAEAKEYVADKKLTVSHYILDPQGKVGHLYGAKTTPYMFVIDANGNVAYMGAVDDKATPDPATLAGAHNYVQAAVQSLLEGTAVATPSTQAYGCSVKYGD